MNTSEIDGRIDGTLTRFQQIEEGGGVETGEIVATILADVAFELSKDECTAVRSFVSHTLCELDAGVLEYEAVKRRFIEAAEAARRSHADLQFATREREWGVDCPTEH